ncbi:MAG: tetratricopeptide repeat protein [Rhizobiaceae bacterium]|nr:tetratricopeptide repeat protein [Rhizobiaceae bacterium]
MSDDSFIREVNEELRQDQAKALWRRYGPVVIGAAVLVVAATAAWVGYDYWTQSRANASGDRFSAALELASKGQLDEAQAAFEALQADGYGAYPVLAKLRAATVQADRGEADAAVAEFDAVAADSSVPASIRDMARLRAGYVLVDSGSYDDVSARVEILTADSSSLRHAAREALALSAWREGRAADALGLFEQISDDDTAPRNARQRANVMVELLRGSGAAS